MLKKKVSPIKFLISKLSPPPCNYNIINGMCLEEICCWYCLKVRKCFEKWERTSLRDHYCTRYQRNRYCGAIIRALRKELK